MKTTKINVGNKLDERVDIEIPIQDFTSIEEFSRYITYTKKNAHGARHNASYNSKSSDIRKSKTNSFEEADELLKNGWNKSIELTSKLRQLKSDKKVIKSFYDVAGFQVSVPRYLQGVPTSMINQKRVFTHSKVITINKLIGYGWQVSARQIEEESIKLLKLINDLEASGIRVNLNVSKLSYDNSMECVGFRIRVKKSSERLNISKLAYPLVHPSMNRRHGWRWLERSEIVKTDYVGYGYPVSPKGIQIIDGEYWLPTFVDENSIDELLREVQ